jgi:hypothetical protein
MKYFVGEKIHRKLAAAESISVNIYISCNVLQHQSFFMKTYLRPASPIPVDEKNLHLFQEDTDLVEVLGLIHQTIDDVYPAYYNPQVVAYYKEYHSAKSIAERAVHGITLVYRANHKIIATGSLVGDYLTALYVGKDFQRNGLGILIMKVLIRKAWQHKLTMVRLDSTPGAKSFHLQLGFKIVSDEIQWVDEIHPLEYTVMELRKTN